MPVVFYHQKFLLLPPGPETLELSDYITELRICKPLCTHLDMGHLHIPVVYTSAPSYVYTHYNNINYSNVHRHAHIATHFTFKGRYEHEIKYGCPMGLPSTTSITVTLI